MRPRQITSISDLLDEFRKCGGIRWAPYSLTKKLEKRLDAEIVVLTDKLIGELTEEDMLKIISIAKGNICCVIKKVPGATDNFGDSDGGWRISVGLYLDDICVRYANSHLEKLIMHCLEDATLTSSTKKILRQNQAQIRKYHNL